MNPWVTLALEEYKTLRAESLDSVRNQHTILNYTILLFAGLTGAAAGTWKDFPLLSSFLLIFIIPGCASVVLVIWAGEVARMFRVGLYLRFREIEISKQLGASSSSKPPLYWETWLSTDNRQLSSSPHKQLYLYWKFVLSFFVFSTSSAIIAGCLRSHGAIIAVADHILINRVHLGHLAVLATIGIGTLGIVGYLAYRMLTTFIGDSSLKN